MTQAILRNLSSVVFRANPAFELKTIETLPPEYTELIKETSLKEDIYGLLLPVDASAIGAKAVCQDTALLLFTLQRPGLIPEYVRRKSGESYQQEMAELVLDEVLQIEESGEFISGAQAFSVLFEDTTQQQPIGKLAALSLEAIKQAQVMEVDNSLQLSSFLYSYNRLPASQRWRARFPDENSVVDFLAFKNIVT